MRLLTPAVRDADVRHREHIAYAGEMVQVTISKLPHIRNVLGASAWIYIEAPSADKWVAAEGEAILQP